MSYEIMKIFIHLVPSCYRAFVLSCYRAFVLFCFRAIVLFVAYS